MKKILYWMPNILLLTFVIGYIPMFKFITETYLSSNTGSMFELRSAFEVNYIMRNITLIVLPVSIALKIICSRKNCEVEKKFIGIINIVLFIILFIASIYLNLICRWA